MKPLGFKIEVEGLWIEDTQSRFEGEKLQRQSCPPSSPSQGSRDSG